KPMRNILGMTEKQFRDILAGREELPLPLQEMILQRRSRQLRETLDRNPSGRVKAALALAETADIPKTGPQAIHAALEAQSIDDLEKKAREDLASGKKTKRAPAARILGYADGMRRAGIS